MRFALAQINPLVGDLVGNSEKIRKFCMKSRELNPDLIIFSELSLVGYPPRDLLIKSDFLLDVQKEIDKLVEYTKTLGKTAILFGAPVEKQVGGVNKLFNCAILAQGGEILFEKKKSLLPTYDVFDEVRYFEASSENDVFEICGEKLGITVCEDAWGQCQNEYGICYGTDPVKELCDKGASIIINLSASPFQIGKDEIRYNIFSSHCKKYSVPFVFLNQVGGNDELIFDGNSMILDSKGDVVDCAKSFSEDLILFDSGIQNTSKKFTPTIMVESAYNSLVLGVSDYIRKTGFQSAVIGLSGGIDSAVVACIARDALGEKNVLGITMPGPFSSKGSIVDSKKLADNLGIQFLKKPITNIFELYESSLEKDFDVEGVCRENIQARIRGNILMAFSNKFGHILLSTGNKSELAVGYCTLYGDMSGGLSVISDVPKTLVYEIADFINRSAEVIPKEIIDKEPSAELSPNQKDSDSLPNYGVLDSILHGLIDENKSLAELVELGFDKEIVRWVSTALKRTEFKRRQAPPGLKITSIAFGFGRRMPIAAKY